MGFDEFMDYVANRHHGTPTLRSALDEAALGLTSEAGELAQIVRKYNFEGQGLNPGELILELSDIYHYLALMCSLTMFDLNMLENVNRAKCEATDTGYKMSFEAAMRHWDGKRETLKGTVEGVRAVLCGDRTCSTCKYYQPGYGRCGLTYNDMDPITKACYFYEVRGEQHEEETD